MTCLGRRQQSASLWGNSGGSGAASSQGLIPDHNKKYSLAKVTRVKNNQKHPKTRSHSFQDKRLTRQIYQPFKMCVCVCVCQPLFPRGKATILVFNSRETSHVLWAMVQRSGHNTCGYHGWSPWRACQCVCAKNSPLIYDDFSGCCRFFQVYSSWVFQTIPVTDPALLQFSITTNFTAWCINTAVCFPVCVVCVRDLIWHVDFTFSMTSSWSWAWRFLQCQPISFRNLMKSGLCGVTMALVKSLRFPSKDLDWPYERLVKDKTKLKKILFWTRHAWEARWT